MSFIVPPPQGPAGQQNTNNPTYVLDTTVNLQWSDPNGGLPASLYLAKDDPAFNCTLFNLQRTWCHEIFANNRANVSSYNWIAHSYGYPVTVNNPAFFMIHQGNTTSFFQSHNFNLAYATNTTGSSMMPTSTTAGSSGMTGSAMVTSMTASGATPTTSASVAQSTSRALGNTVGVADMGSSLFALVAVLAHMIW